MGLRSDMIDCNMLQSNAVDFDGGDFYKIHMFSSKRTAEYQHWDTAFHGELIIDAFILLDDAYAWFSHSHTNFISRIYVRSIDSVMQFGLHVSGHLDFNYMRVIGDSRHGSRWNVTRLDFP